MPARDAHASASTSFLLLPHALLAVLLAGAAGSLGAQQEASALLRGEVQRAGAPLEDATVVLHRVTPGEAGEIDSVRVAADGSFEIRLPHVPDPGSRSEVFFASVRHLDILYFGPPISEAAQLDSLYLIEVFDTATAPAPEVEVSVSVRNLFLERIEGGWQATDLFQLLNEGDRTVVAAGDASEGGEAVWSYPLPEGASAFEIGQSDLPPDAAAFSGSTLRTWAPIPPGERLYLVRYVLPDVEFDLPMPGRTGIMELLLLEPAPPLAVRGLRPEQPVELEPGSTYRRYTGFDLAGVVISLTRAEEERRLPMEWLAVALALVLGVAGILALQRRSPLHREAAPGGDSGAAVAEYARSERRAGARTPAGTPADTAESRESLLAEIALLDEAFSSSAAPSEEERAAWRARREALKARVRDLRPPG